MWRLSASACPVSWNTVTEFIDLCAWVGTDLASGVQRQRLAGREVVEESGVSKFWDDLVDVTEICQCGRQLEAPVVVGEVAGKAGVAGLQTVIANVAIVWSALGIFPSDGLAVDRNAKGKKDK